jgi:hypothetical protein
VIIIDMSDIKEDAIAIIKKLPSDVSYDDIIEAITLRKKIQMGTNDLDNGNFISNKKMQKKIDKRLNLIKK